MSEEKKEIESSEEDEKKSESEQEEEKKSEEEESREGEEKKEEEKEEEKEDFEKENDHVPTGKYNQAVRKAREAELRERDLKKELEELKKAPPKKESSKDDDEDDDEDFYEDDEEEKKSKKKQPDIASLVDEKIRPIQERLNQKEENERKTQRTAFFKKCPQYLNDSEKWQELLDEMDNSLNPHSKDSYYQQLTKAHRLLSGNEDSGNSDIEKKKREMAAESSSKGEGAKKPDNNRKNSVDERADRLAKDMPIGYVYKEKK